MADSVERCEFTEDTLTKHVREPYIIATDGKCDYLRIRRQRIELRGLGFAGIDIDVALMVRLEHVRRYRSAAGYESEGTELPGGIKKRAVGIRRPVARVIWQLAIPPVLAIAFS